MHAALPHADTSSPDPLTQQAVELLVTLKAETHRYLAEDRQAGATDILGLHRMELHRPPSLASLLDSDHTQNLGSPQRGKQTPGSKLMSSPNPGQPKYRGAPSPGDDRRNAPNQNPVYQANKSGVGSPGKPSSKMGSDDHRQFGKPGEQGQSSPKLHSSRERPSELTSSDSKPGGNQNTEKSHGPVGMDTPASASSGVEEEVIQKVMSPNSEPDIDKLLFKLDEAIEGRWVEGPASPPVWPVSPEQDVDPTLDNADRNWSEEDNTSERTNAMVPSIDKTRLHKTSDPSLDGYNHNLDTPENQDKNNTKNRYYKSKNKTAGRSYKPLKHKNQVRESKAQNNQSAESNAQGNQSEEDWDSLVGGASVDSFLLHPEDVFNEPTRGAVRYHSDVETAANQPSAGRSYDSGSEGGAVSAASFLLSHEDVFSENTDTFDTHF